MLAKMRSTYTRQVQTSQVAILPIGNKKLAYSYSTVFRRGWQTVSWMAKYTSHVFLLHRLISFICYCSWRNFDKFEFGSEGAVSAFFPFYFVCAIVVVTKATVLARETKKLTANAANNRPAVTKISLHPHISFFRDSRVSLTPLLYF